MHHLISLVATPTPSSWPACHEFEPSTAEDPPCRAGRCSLNMSRLKRLPIGLVWNLGEGCQNRCRPRHLSMVQNYEIRCRKTSSCRTHHIVSKLRGRGSRVVKVSDRGRHVMSSSPVPLKIHRVGQRCTLNLSRAETSSRWCGS
ncbi:hypothetical protein TNCV_278641 [Trichonephila clavipes]|nr:hypothetical protein TNCV_278641 [Trichonephila clavipes]